MGIFKHRRFNHERIDRFDVVKTNAINLGDNTKPERIGILVETNKYNPYAKDQINVLIASKRAMTDPKTGKLKENALKQKKEGWIKEIKGPGVSSKNKRSAVAMQLYKVNENEVESTGVKLNGKAKRRTINHVYNYVGKTKRQRKVVKKNRYLRNKFKK